ncbi:MAG: hypothetical protein U1D70_14115 [Methylobacter sp.]|nr:hypothetical protein [Methylobacter sp.]
MADEYQDLYNDKIAQINQDLRQIINVNLVGNSQLPVFNLGVIKGVPVVVDLNKFAVPLSYVADTVIFGASLFAILMLL